jgi:hypothetical protein
MHQGGGGQAADQGRGDDQQRPRERRRAAGAGPATAAMGAYVPACVLGGVSWNVTAWGADPTAVTEQM